MSMSFDGPVLLAGAGQMGAALLAGWLQRGVDAHSIIVQEPDLKGEAAELVARHGLRVLPPSQSLERPPSVIVVAVKPQVMDQVFPSLAKLAGPATVVLSIAAGRSIANFEKHLAADTAVVRAMPNTPAAIGRGITAAVGNSAVKPAQRKSCHDLLAAVGEVVWLGQEHLIDTVTAVSGSGPAYVFWLAECLAQAGCDAGLDRETALILARATVSGAGELLRQSKDDPAILRQNVTSPGGTTAAALAVLMRDQNGMQSLLHEAVLAALQRSRELGS